MPAVYKQSFKQNYTNNIELSIFNCGLERCAPGQTWGPGIRDHYLIHLVVSGKGIFEVGGRTWEVSEGDLFFARPSQLIRYTADEQQPWEYSWVGFNGACAHKLAAQLPFTDDAPVHHTSDPDGMRAALNNIYSSRGLQPQDEAAMVGYLYLFIAALMRETSAGKPHTASSSSQYVLNAIKYNQPAIAEVIKAARDIQRSRLLGNQASKYLESKIIDCLSGFLLPASLLPSAQTFSLSIRDKIHDAQSIILTHYQEMPSLHELAAMVGTNECTLKKAFKQEFGTTVFQYLFDFRMDLAVHYLLDTSLPIADIGIMLGYDYQSHFCTAFKRKHGVSPMEFRLRRGVIART